MNNSKTFKSDLKIIVVGNSGTGKTSFVNKWIKNTFSDTYKATIVSEFGYKIFEHKGKYYRIQLWDLAGQDKNTHITKIFCRDAHGCVIVSDITNAQSLKESIKWKNSIDENARFMDNGMLPSILIENKIDLVSEEEAASTAEIRQFSEKNKFSGHFRTSAKMGININESMEFLIQSIIARMGEYSKDGQIPTERDRKSIVLDHPRYIPSDERIKDGCC